MKASEMIKQLEGLIAEHGDLPLAILEEDEMYHKIVFVESSGIDGVYTLDEDDLFYDIDDCCVDVSKVFLLD